MITPGAGGSARSSSRCSCPVGADEDHADRAGRRLAAARRGADDDRRSAAGDGAGGGAGGARLLGVEAEQEAETQRIREHGGRPAGLGDLDGGQRSERQLGGVGDLVDDRHRPVEAIADQDAVVAVDDGGGDAPAALAGVTQPRRRDVEVLSRPPRSPPRRRVAPARSSSLVSRPAPTPRPDGVWLAGSGDRRALQRQLLDPAELEQVGLHRVQLGEQPELRARAQRAARPATAARRCPSAQSADPLVPVVGHAPHEQPARLAPRFDARDCDLGRRVADIDAGDQHPSDEAGRGHSALARARSPASASTSNRSTVSRQAASSSVRLSPWRRTKRRLPRLSRARIASMTRWKSRSGTRSLISRLAALGRVERRPRRPPASRRAGTRSPRRRRRA